MKKLLLLGVVAAVSVCQPAVAGEAKKSFVIVNQEFGVPVFPHDIKDRPYTVVGPVKAGVRKATVFSKDSSQGKIYRELWERAEKLGADAVINANYGEAHMSMMSWGKTNATGTAIRFIAAPATPAPEAAPAPVSEPAPAIAPDAAPAAEPAATPSAN
jgi:hypothetical protein